LYFSDWSNGLSDDSALHPLKTREPASSAAMRTGTIALEGALAVNMLLGPLPQTIALAAIRFEGSYPMRAPSANP
jgi:hypothetical protein